MGHSNDNTAGQRLSLDNCRSLKEALADLVAKRDRISRQSPEWSILARMVRQLEAEIALRAWSQ
jgi:hypothetical protein